MMKSKNKIIELILDGLNTDGDHHKQWYLEEILKKIVGKKKFNALKEDTDWEKGV